ncbi:hypothetical protein BVRB_1g018130 [Beta vulgaris subsp. vulgaris]|uniref:histone-lysine N-methyltransferase ASHR2 n=1 Tax=Beta vulgaris subsp. vulgaris TaxID=3555 RepID=UPI00054022B8|nr:histone-lysine N-methyltransferase ASHR2 [Beta vulgaris subsp. vulgaris]KMS99971.1 hypothetical protein BVRB_1g018130 [Beta vulgaris subsp. vulgaris]
MAVADNHALISPFLRLVDIEGKGRGLVASQPLKGGQTVLRDSPILTYSAFPLKRQGDGFSYSRYCGHCYRLLVTGDRTLACPSCSHPDDAIYCSPKCQSLALRFTHTPWVCQSLSYLRNCPLLVDQQPEDRPIQARYLVAALNLAMVNPPFFQTLMSLDGGGPHGGERDSDAAIFLHSIISALPFPEGLSAPSVEITAALLSKDRCNSFGLMEPFSEHGERSVRAYAIYSNASFFNHDCLPNACRFDYLDTETEGNTDMIIRMIHDIPEGQEICLSYFPVNLSYPGRQKRLLDDYGFSCFCDRCKIEAKWPDEDDDGEDESMEEEDEEMSPSDVENNEIEHEGDDDFPHAYFFVRFVCDKENCGGTLAPLPPSNNNTPNIMECNACGSLKKEEL